MQTRELILDKKKRKKQIKHENMRVEEKRRWKNSVREEVDT